MFGTIVWATDGSELADETLPLVTELAGIPGSKIVAVHVNELFRGGRFGGGPLFADENELQEKIAAQVNDMREAGFDAELDVVTSRRHDTEGLIAEAATTAGADLIVIGTHGRSVTAAMFLGSVTTGLAHVAPCPVPAVPPRSQRAPGAQTSRHRWASVSPAHE